ncbi:hypothetical protein D9756_004239 [Leucocoprinus leucothites]|uniref:Major facilitator superfamily (MFS) profile domain-containing protein n=1 Tax=Leucocoprinus leucothites TaxID=201217 RepID=A0A8H5LFZ8_9AGAR|nr:hypothetical protein D9756_004239 [Leucoagaricus leucothites]
MTTLLTTAVDESCQVNGTLRGRRRSSVHPLSAVPRLFFTPQPPSESSSGYFDESAVADDPEVTSWTSDTSPGGGTTLLASARSTVAHISPLSHAHFSDYASKMVVPRHQNSSGVAEFEMTSLPSTPGASSSVTTAVNTTVNSRKASFENDRTIPPQPERVPNFGEVKETLERMKWRLTAGYFAFFMCGWGDGITGTVLPFFMADFHVSFTMSSLLFTGTTVGFLSGTFLVEVIMKTLARTPVERERSAWIPHLAPARTRRSRGGDVRESFLQAQHLSLVLSSLMHATFFVMMGSTRGYITIFSAYVLAAFARAILTATLNLYFKRVMPQSLGYSYGLWSFGGVISPLICQTLVAAGVPWKHFYYGSLVLSAFNTGLLSLTFRPTTTEWIRECNRAKRRNTVLTRRNTETTISSSDGKLDIGPSTSRASQEVHEPSATLAPQATKAPQSALRLTLSMPMTWAFSIFVLMYYGCETSTQGFIVSYLLDTRHADPKTVGYVASGFWAGISIGRFGWGYFMPRMSFTQNKWLVQTSLGICLVMQLLIWFVNSNAANAFFTSVIGLVCGPVYPSSLSLATMILPEETHMVSMALIGAAGSLGSAIFPFIAGLISTSKGVQTVTYITTGLAGFVFIMWMLFPSRAPGTTR